LALPDQPKRPLSAFNYLFRSERAKFMKLRPPAGAAQEGPPIENDSCSIWWEQQEEEGQRHRKAIGQGHTSVQVISFRAISNQIAARCWQVMTEEEKCPFIELAEEDQARYNREMEIWNGNLLSAQHIASCASQLSSLVVGGASQLSNPVKSKDTTPQATVSVQPIAAGPMPNDSESEHMTPPHEQDITSSRNVDSRSNLTGDSSNGVGLGEGELVNEENTSDAPPALPTQHQSVALQKHTPSQHDTSDSEQFVDFLNCHVLPFLREQLHFLSDDHTPSPQSATNSSDPPKSQAEADFDDFWKGNDMCKDG
jgi:hypothetical protein